MVRLFPVSFVEGRSRAKKDLLWSTQHDRHASSLQKSTYFSRNFLNAFLSSIGAVGIALELDVAVVTDIQLLYRNTVLWIDDRSHPSEKPSQTTWTEVLSAFLYASQSSKTKGRSHDDHLSISSVFNDTSHSQIIRVHYYFNLYLSITKSTYNTTIQIPSPSIFGWMSIKIISISYKPSRSEKSRQAAHRHS